MTSELMRATVAEPQGDAREGGAEGSGRQIRGHRNTNRQRGRLWAASVLVNAKPKAHQDTASRAGWDAEKVKDLTRGDLSCESRREVSRSHSRREQSRGLEEKRGLRFARYADDCNIYVKSQAAAERVLASLTGWIKRHLRLEVSESKSGVGRPWERKFLGFIITSALLIGIAPASLTRFEDRVRELWNARQPLTSEQLRDQWRSYVNGWWGYYRRCEWRRDIYRKEPWIRRHIRKCFWQRWHKSKGRESAPAIP